MAKFVPSSPASRSAARRRALICSRACVEKFEPRLFLSGTGNLAFDDEFNQAVGSQPNTADWDGYFTNDPNNQSVNYTNTTSTLSVVSDPAATDGRFGHDCALIPAGEWNI